MKAVVAAFNQEKALVGAFSVIVQPVVEPLDRFAALVFTNNHHHQLKKLRSSSNPAVALGGVVSELVRQPGPAVVHREHDPALQHLLAAVHGAEPQHKLPGDVLGVVDEGQGFPPG